MIVFVCASCREICRAFLWTSSCSRMVARST
uniref:Uncharacterized protein n=2 Tax=unclassified Caudoviricetes TaxID=2788787 RepID=A0A8S5NB27_9CAUD|nr:MAG TPA: hypothetical protein [Siphoviridae sp. ctCOj19]DAD91628.1 MAG TPA: hypothetical protein [Siphoviridae sp. ctjd446]DAQ38311.1 MAG TPA: hypothetical protein [Caudoviricetes sp.]